MKIVTKLVTKYICDICGAEYSEKEEAEECERKHLSRKIVLNEYRDGCKVPYKIIAEYTTEYKGEVIRWRATYKVDALEDIGRCGEEK